MLKARPQTQTQVVNNVVKKWLQWDGKYHLCLIKNERLGKDHFTSDFINYDFNDEKTKKFIDEMTFHYKDTKNTFYTLEITNDKYPKIVKIISVGGFKKWTFHI